MSIKTELISFCNSYLEDRIEAATVAIAEARLSSVNETKSSAGDKYETSREMLQGVIEQHTNQLQEARRMLANFKMILQNSSVLIKAGAGSVVETNAGNFFLSIPAGMTEIQGIKYAMISLNSPIGKLLIEKGKGDSLSFNGRDYTITAVIN